MTEGLKDVKYAILEQENDPLEFCVLPVPLPSKIGIPCFPCELPNNYWLFQSNENHTQIGMVEKFVISQKIMDLEEDSNCHERSLCYPSMRSFRMTSRDFYNNIPIYAERLFSKLVRFRPQINVRYEGQYAGKVVEPFEWNFCKCQFHELDIYDKNNELKYKLKASLKQPGIGLFLPFQKCQKITYQIYDSKKMELDEEIEPLNSQSFVCGQIDHIFSGWDNEFCSKADKYGIIFPDDASEKDKALIVMAVIFIDYLWFENF